MVDEKQQSFELRISQLEHALNVSRVVNVAVGILMVKFRMSQEDAQNVLNQSARSQKRKLVEIAQAQIRAAEAVASPRRANDPKGGGYTSPDVGSDVGTALLKPCFTSEGWRNTVPPNR